MVNDGLLSLKGKVALVTGAAQGQGAAEAELLTRHGAQVMLTDVSDAAGSALASKLADASYSNLDVAREDAWSEVVGKTVDRYGRLDILVNNAGISHFEHLASTDTAAFDRVMDINMKGVFLGMRAAHPEMRKSGGGAIVNIASIAALTGRAGLATYAASKWAIRGLSRSAALDFALDRIRVNTIFPGLIDTPMTRNAYGAERLAERGAAIPVGRAGLPSDIANLVLFLVSDAAGFINGGEFIVDGGETAGQRI